MRKGTENVERVFSFEQRESRYCMGSRVGGLAQVYKYKTSVPPLDDLQMPY